MERIAGHRRPLAKRRTNQQASLHNKHAFSALELSTERQKEQSVEDKLEVNVAVSNLKLENLLTVSLQTSLPPVTFYSNGVGQEFQCM